MKTTDLIKMLNDQSESGMSKVSMHHEKIAKELTRLLKKNAELEKKLRKLNKPTDQTLWL